jgi:hypothetical protein
MEMARPYRRGIVSSNGRTNAPKNQIPVFQLATLNPKYTKMMPIAIGMRSVTIQTHHTSP